MLLIKSGGGTGPMIPGNQYVKDIHGAKSSGFLKPEDKLVFD
jgi:hypothetical protein